MKILCLYNNRCAEDLFQWLGSQGHETVLWQERLDPAWCVRERFDLTVSYTYRHILTGAVLDALGGKAVNLHTSFLPWERGADPNIWSLLDGAPRGVTLHYMSPRLDQGDIIAQELIEDGSGETLSSTYEHLDEAAKGLFRKAFRYHPYWDAMRKTALGAGSYHAVRDGTVFRSLIETYDMPVDVFRERYREAVRERERERERDGRGVKPGSLSESYGASGGGIPARSPVAYRSGIGRPVVPVRRAWDRRRDRSWRGRRAVKIGASENDGTEARI